MSSATLQSWLKQNIQAIPAIPLYAQQARKAVEKKHFDKLPLSQIIASDPGLSSQLFNLVNAKRKGTKREYIESILSALSLMGDAGIVNFVNKTTTIDDVRTSFDCENNYYQLVARSQQAAEHAKQWGEIRNSQGIKEIGIATRLYDIAEFSLCLFDFDNYKTYKQLNFKQHNQDEHCLKLFGFTLNDLSIALCDHFHLPDLVLEAHNNNEIAGIRSQGIQISSKLMHQADNGWFHKEALHYVQKAADLCQINIDKMTTMVHITSVKTAQELEFNTPFHSASNLVLHEMPPRPVSTTLKAKEQIKQAPKKPETSKPKPVSLEPRKPTPKVAHPLLNELKSIAQNKKTSQALLLTSLLKGCNEHLKTKRNALFLLSPDRSKLGTRLHSGLSEKSPLLKFTVTKQQAGLLKILLEKPQAIWVNAENYKKYEKMLPGIFKSCTLSDDFFMMSLFSGKKPVGIVYCDNYGEKQPLDNEKFISFKQAVGLSSKAMLLISQRQASVKS